MKSFTRGTVVWYVANKPFITLLHGRVRLTRTKEDGTTLVTVDWADNPDGYTRSESPASSFSFTADEAIKRFMDETGPLLEKQKIKGEAEVREERVHDNMVVEGGEYITISSGTSVNVVEVRRGGTLQIDNGGRVVCLHVLSGGSCNLHSVGEAAQVRVQGLMYCSGWMTEVDVQDGGSLIVCQGNSVTDVEVRNSGRVNIRSGASVYTLRATCGGSAEVHLGATVSKTVVDTYGSVTVDPLASITSVTINIGGTMEVQDGAKIHEARITSGGTMFIAQTAEINAMAKDSGGRIKECKCVL